MSASQVLNAPAY